MRSKAERQADFQRREALRKAKYAAGMERIRAKDAKFKADAATAKAERAAALIEAQRPAPITDEQKRIHNQLSLGMSSSSLADTMNSPAALLLLPATLSMMRKERKLAKRIKAAEQGAEPPAET